MEVWSIRQNKTEFFSKLCAGSVVPYGCTTWRLTKRIEEKLDGNCIRLLGAVLNKSWRQDVAKQQLSSHLSPISKTIKVRWASIYPLPIVAVKLLSTYFCNRDCVAYTHSTISLFICSFTSLTWTADKWLNFVYSPCEWGWINTTF